MTDQASTMPLVDADPSAVVRTWQQQLQSAFGVARPDSATPSFADLRAGLAAGRFGGLPIDGPVADGLVVLLERLGWPCSFGRIARAMPHYPVQFDIDTMCDVVARLGYSSRRVQCKEGELTSADVPALMTDNAANPRVVDFVDGALRLLDASGSPTTERLSKGRHTFHVFRRTKREDGRPTEKSWLTAQLSRMTGPFGLLFALTGFINLMVLVTSFTVMAIYDTVIPTESFDTLTAIVIGLAVAASLELSFRRLKARIIGRMSGRLEYMVGTAIFSKLLSLPTEMISSVPIGVQMSRLGQFETVRDLFAGPFAAIVLEIPFVFIFIAVLFAIGGPLGYIAVALTFAYAVLGALLLPSLRRRVAESTRLRQERQALMLETASNIRTIRTAGCEAVWSERLCTSIRKASEANRRSQALNRLLVNLSAAGVPIAGGATAIIGAALVMSGELSVGVLVGAMIVIWRVLAPIQQAFLTLTRSADLAATLRQIDQMMRMKGSASAEETPVRRKFSGQITFDRLSFRYPATSQLALAGLTAEIKAGEFVAVTGRSGAGKTTLMRMVLDLYQPQSGIVCIDDINVRQIPDDDLRAGIGYVPQKVALFHGTIAQNLRLAAPEANDDDLRRVAAELGVLAAIDGLPRGFETQIDHESRDRLPTGFRQVLAIAQALLRNPQILLFDEPAQALDPVIEDHFVNAILKRRGRVTTIMVTHRPSHSRKADRVLVLDRGQASAFDTPDVIFAETDGGGA